MGRHTEHGEDALPSRGKRTPKVAPESVDHDEPIGRRLRPEESAVTEAGTEFLRSGWSAESEPSGPVRREERLPGGRKMMLLAVAAMVVVLGGTVVGVQVMTAAGSSTDCPPSGCVLAESNQSAPQTEITGPDGESTLGQEPGEESEEGTEGGTAEPAPTPTATRRSAAASEPSPTRAPKTTRAPRPTVDEPLPADAHSPADRPESDRPEPTDRPADRPERADEPEPSRSPTSAPPADDGTHAAQPPATTAPTQASEATTPAGATAIKVDVDLVREQRRSGYTVKVVVAADERLDGVKLSLPVSGKVSSVSGAGWKQVGDTLVIESGKDLEAGEKLVVNFTAYGRAEVPETCESSQGECAVV